jgi:hypothetical protein
MSRKDYVLLADALAYRRPEVSWLNKAVQWRHDVDAIATALGRDNPRFDRTRFIKACGEPSGKVP